MLELFQQNALGIPTPASLPTQMKKKKNPCAFKGHEGFALHINLMKLYHKHNFIRTFNQYLTTGSPAAIVWWKIFLVYLRLDVKPLNHDPKKINTKLGINFIKCKICQYQNPVQSFTFKIDHIQIVLVTDIAMGAEETSFYTSAPTQNMKYSIYFCEMSIF